MSTYDMIERIPKNGPRDLLLRDAFTGGHSYSRFDIEASDGALWRRGFVILRKHWKASLAFAVVLELILSLVVFSMANLFEARAVLDVEPPGADVMNGQNTPSVPSNASAYFETQAEILKSDGLALSVINQLHLDQNPIFMKQTSMQKAVAWAAGWFPSHQSTEQRDTDKLINAFRNGLTVGQVKGSQLLEVGYTASQPQLAAQIVNATVDQYLDKTYRSRYEATLRAAASLSPPLADLQKSVKKSTDALLDFQRMHDGAQLGAVSTVGSDGMTNTTSATLGNPVAARVSELNQQLTQAMGERLQQESYMKQIRQGNVDSLPQMKDNVLIQGLTTRLVDSRAQLAQALGVYGGNSPEVRKLELQVDEVNKQLASERARIGSQIESAYSSAQNREQLIRNTLRGMKGELDQSTADALQYDALKREADADANLYTTVSSRTKELALSGSLSSSNIRVLDEARAPLKPNGPHRLRILGIGAIFGIFGGVILAFVAENMNDKLSSADDLRRWCGLPALALVPQIVVKGDRRALPRGKSARVLTTASMAAVRMNGLNFLTEKPNSPEAEAIRSLETAIRIPIPSSGRSVQIVLITSALPGEGKTIVATNLALALARHGKTCLIDADLRHPSITSSFGLSQRVGLQDLLGNTMKTTEDIVKPHPEIPNLSVIGAGNRMPNALEALTSERMTDLMNELRKKFEYVVIDTPPIIPFSEGRWLSTISDASILVARCGTTTRGAMSWSLQILEELKSEVLGVVLNGVDLDAEYYSYGMQSHSSYAAM